MVDNTFMIKKLQSMKEVHVIFSRYTNMPYVECDPETYDDQIHILSTEEEVQEFAKEYTEKKILLMAKKLPKVQLLPVLGGMFSLGVNAVFFHNNGTSARIQLEELVKKPDMEKIKDNPVPLMNPTLTLSALYFLQELHRPVEHDKQQLKELEDEMIVNLVRSKYILGMTTADPKEKFDPKDPKQPKRVSYVKNKDDQMFLPVFSDLGEFQKFYKEKARDTGMAIVTFDKLPKSIVKDAIGMVLNPAGFHLHIGTEQLEKIVQVYCKN